MEWKEKCKLARKWQDKLEQAEHPDEIKYYRTKLSEELELWEPKNENLEEFLVSIKEHITHKIESAMTSPLPEELQLSNDLTEKAPVMLTETYQRKLKDLLSTFDIKIEYLFRMITLIAIRLHVDPMGEEFDKMEIYESTDELIKEITQLRISDPHD